MEVVAVTPENVFLRCIDCGQETSLQRRSIRKGEICAPQCPNEDCISFWNPRIMEDLPSLRCPPSVLLFDAWQHIGDVVLLLSAVTAFLAFLVLDWVSLAYLGFLLVALFFIHRFRFNLGIRWEIAVMRCSVLLVAAAYLSKTAAAWGILLMLVALLLRQLAPEHRSIE